MYRDFADEGEGVIAKEKSIDEKYPRPTPEDVLKTLERITKGADEETTDSTTDGEAVNELGN
jgi:hypothetical protein